MEDKDPTKKQSWHSKLYDEGKISEETAELLAKFMFAMSYYHDRMKLHIILHPVFYLAGFITAYYLMGN